MDYDDLQVIARAAYEARRSFQGEYLEWDQLENLSTQIENVKNALKPRRSLNEIQFEGELDFEDLVEMDRIGRMIFINVARTMAFKTLIRHPEDTPPPIPKTELCVSEATMTFGNINTLNIYHNEPPIDED